MSSRHGTIITEAAKVITARRASYGEPADNFRRASAIASNILGVAISPHMVAIVMHSMKLARMAESPLDPDHYVDGVSYLAFAGEFATLDKPAELTNGPRGTTTDAVP